jgi:hypothetical protein
MNYVDPTPNLDEKQRKRYVKSCLSLAILKLMANKEFEELESRDVISVLSDLIGNESGSRE